MRPATGALVAGVTGPEPPPQPETVVLAPGPDYVWVGGAWVWLGDRWVWHRGYRHRPMHPYRRIQKLRHAHTQNCADSILRDGRRLLPRSKKHSI